MKTLTEAEKLDALRYLIDAQVLLAQCAKESGDKKAEAKYTEQVARLRKSYVEQERKVNSNKN
jgi:TPP-dependent trihydroxycyclohexane-1,2-dione (THcHDO) dehydratase